MHLLNKYIFIVYLNIFIEFYICLLFTYVYFMHVYELHYLFDKLLIWSESVSAVNAEKD